MVFQLCGVKLLVSNNEIVSLASFSRFWSKPFFLADEDWAEDPREEDFRSSYETDLLWAVCRWRGIPYNNMITVNLCVIFLLLECQDYCTHHRQNEELRGEKYSRLQCGGGHISGGCGEYRDEVSMRVY